MAEAVDFVDISALFAGNDGLVAECDSAIWTGLRRTGSIVVTGYPDAEMVDVRARRGLEIFDFAPDVIAPLVTRLVTPGNTNAYRGYWPCTSDRLLKNDFFDVGPTQPTRGPHLPGMDILTEQTIWPAGQPDWAKVVRAHYDTLNRIAQALIQSIGRSAGFDADEIAWRFAGEHSTLRFLNYAAGAGHDQMEGNVAVSAGAHTDASGLSLLWQGAPGLQACGQDGVWRDIPMQANAISVHVGDVMTRLTNGVVPATPHRVLAGQTARQSVGFFLEPALAAPVTSADYSGALSIEDTYAWQLLATFAQRDIWKGVIRHPSEARST
ncbi:MAG: 2OG-Fe(II) oxygenase family protein [Paracoccaceae bacterium]